MAREAFGGKGQAEYRYRIRLVLNWLDHYNLAQELLQREGEVYQRTAVSKAYYAMFYNARSLLKSWWEWNPKDDESHHHYLWNTFSNKQDAQSQQIGEEGHRLRGARNDVDYEEHLEDLSATVDLAMIRVERLRNALGKS